MSIRVQQEPQPEPEPQLEPEPEPEPELAQRRWEEKSRAGREKFLKSFKTSGTRPTTTIGEEEWLHGEMVFEGEWLKADSVTKFLVVPDHVEDPEEILQKMLGEWGMPMPNMTISVMSAIGDYFAPVATEERLDGYPSDSKMGKYLREVLWENWPENWRNGKEGPAAEQAAAAKFSGRMTEMMYGICRAAAESKGWIVHKMPSREGANFTGGIVDPGVEKFKSVRQAESRDLVNVAFGVKGESLAKAASLKGAQLPVDWEDTNEARREGTNSGKWSEETRAEAKALWEALVPRLDEKSAVALGEEPEQRVIFPFLEANSADQIGHPGFPMDSGWGLRLRTECSHMVFTKSLAVNEKLKILTEDLVPHVVATVSGKDNPFSWNFACDAASRGAQIILLENSGKVVDEMVQTVKKRQKEQATTQLDGPALDSPPNDESSAAAADGEKQEEEAALEWPDSVKSSSFLIFDAVKDSSDRVIEKLTTALATVGGDEMREMGFAQTEQERLKYAWELCVLFRHNAAALQWKARKLQILITLAAFVTTLCAVLLTASNGSQAGDCSAAAAANDEAGFKLDGFVTISSGWQDFLSLACAVVPMLSAFLLALGHKFAYTKRWATITVAAERVCSEIYLYRARVGDYQQRTKNAKLVALVKARQDATNSGGRDPKTKADSEQDQTQPKLTTRESFHENLQALQTELMGSEVKMASMHKPPANAAKLLRNQLYPFGETTGVEPSGAADAAAARNDLNLLEEGLSDFSLLGTAMHVDGNVIDDGIGLISAEDYIKFRLLPAISRLNDTIPRQERWYNLSQTLILLATMLASVSGVIGLHVWIPAVAALVAVVESLSHFDQTAARLAGANGALTQLKNLRLWWQSLSRTQQSLPHNKAQLVESSEDAILSELGAWTQGILRKKKKVDAAKEDEEGNGASPAGNGLVQASVHQ